MRLPSLLQRTVLYTLALLAVLEIMEGALLYQAHRRLTHTLQQRDLILARHLASRVHSQMVVPLRNLQLVGQEIDAHYPMESWIKLLENLSRFDPIWHEVDVVQPTGTLVLNYPPHPNELGLDFSRQRAFLLAQSQNGVFWTRSFLSAEIGESMVSVSYRTQRGFVVIGHLRTRDLSSLLNLDNSLQLRGRMIALLDNQGVAIGHSNPAVAEQQESFWFLQGVRTAAHGTEATSIENLNNASTLVNTVPVPETSWIVMVYTPHAEVLAEVFPLAVNLFLVPLATIVIVAASMQIFRKKLFLPLESLFQGIEDVGRGKFSTPPSPVFREFSPLVKSFQEMLEKLAEREKALRLSEQKFRLLAESSADLICVHDEEMHLAYVSPSAHELLGRSPESLLGLSFATLAPSQKEQDQIRAVFNDVLLTQKRSKVEMHLTNEASHKEVILEVSFAPMPRGADSSLFIQSVSRDLTERIRMELALHRAKIAAETADRAKSLFLANMSHELRTPLTAVLGFLELLQTEKQGSEKYENYLHLIESNAAHLLTVIERLMEVLQLESGGLSLIESEFSVTTVALSCFTALEPQVDKKVVEYHCTLDPQLANSYVGDEARLRQILANLLSNSVKFTKRGSIRFSVVLEERDEHQDHLKFSITDTGVGIHSVFQERLFHLFAQQDDSLTRKFGGAGVGLFLTKEIVEAMHGNITLESVENQGTSVHVTLSFHRK